MLDYPFDEVGNSQAPAKDLDQHLCFYPLSVFLRSAGALHANVCGGGVGTRGIGGMRAPE